MPSMLTQPWLRAAALSTAAWVCSGCQPNRPPPATKPSADLAALRPKPATVSQLLQLQIYQVTVPAGSISRSEPFWKHVDEQQVDAATYDLLLKNGVRVGVAPVDDWDYFKDILDRNPATAVTGVAAASGGGTVELTMKKGVVTEDIFYFDDKGEMHGRSYERCENLLGISFWPEPRHPGEVRVSVSPTVRSLRSRLEYTVLNGEREIQEVRPEFLYDLNLRAVIAADKFMVIAPSSESKVGTSLGNTFFRVDGPTEQYEQVLILAPRSGIRIGPTAAAQ